MSTTKRDHHTKAKSAYNTTLINRTISDEERRANFIEFGNYVSPMDFGGAEIVIHGSRRQTDNHRAFAQRLGATAA